jgi:hypothetical protein
VSGWLYDIAVNLTAINNGRSAIVKKTTKSVSGVAPPGTVARQYEERLPLLRRLEEEARYILDSALKREGVKLDGISSRIKDLNSFQAKIKRKQTSSPFEDIPRFGRTTCRLPVSIRHTKDIGTDRWVLHRAI